MAAGPGCLRIPSFCTYLSGVGLGARSMVVSREDGLLVISSPLVLKEQDTRKGLEVVGAGVLWGSLKAGGSWGPQNLQF